MRVLKLRQFEYESHTWKRLLAFIIDENIRLKNRLSEILSNGFNKNLLEDLENFNSRFVKEDELIGLIRNEVAELDKLMMREIFLDGNIIEEIGRKLKIIRNNIQIAEREFTKVNIEFNNYLAENV
jgi:hypothetical protein